MRASVQGSLERLQTEHIDILQIHGRLFSPQDVDHVVNGGPLKALVRLREEGKIGHIGITSEEPWTLIPFLDQPDIEIYQIAYNLIYQGAARHFLPQAAEAGVGVVSMRTMTSGILQREASFLAPEWQPAHDLYDAALKFVLSDSRVHAGIVGMRWPHEVTAPISASSTAGNPQPISPTCPESPSASTKQKTGRESEHRVAAVDDQDRTGHERGGVAGQEHNAGGYLVDSGVALLGHVVDPVALELRPINWSHVRSHVARCDGVDSDSGRRPFRG